MVDEAEKHEGKGAAEESAGADAPAPKRRSTLLLVVSAAVLLAGGAAATWYLGLLPFGGPAGHAEATAAAPGGHGGEEGGHGKGHGGGGGSALLALDSFIANLADEGGTRYLKTTFQVEFRGGATPSGIDAAMPELRDLLLTLLSSKTYDEIRTPEGKQQLREDIIARVNQVARGGEASAVYFTEFIVQ